MGLLTVVIGCARNAKVCWNVNARIKSIYMQYLISFLIYKYRSYLDVIVVSFYFFLSFFFVFFQDNYRLFLIIYIEPNMSVSEIKKIKIPLIKKQDLRNINEKKNTSSLIVMTGRRMGEQLNIYIHPLIERCYNKC